MQLSASVSAALPLNVTHYWPKRNGANIAYHGPTPIDRPLLHPTFYLPRLQVLQRRLADYRLSLTFKCCGDA